MDRLSKLIEFAFGDGYGFRAYPAGENGGYHDVLLRGPVIRHKRPSLWGGRAVSCVRTSLTPPSNNCVNCVVQTT